MNAPRNGSILSWVGVLVLGVACAVAAWAMSSVPTKMKQADRMNRDLAKLRARHPAAEVVMTVPRAYATLYATRPYGVVAQPFDRRLSEHVPKPPMPCGRSIAGPAARPRHARGP